MVFFFLDDGGNVDELGHAALGEEEAGGTLGVGRFTIFRFFFPARELAEADVGVVPVGDE